MTHVVAKPCFACKYTDCVVVCPVECFYEGEQMLYIHPDECIDCEACVPECPVDAIFHEDNVPEEWKDFIQLNAEMAPQCPQITEKKEPLGGVRRQCGRLRSRLGGRLKAPGGTREAAGSRRFCWCVPGLVRTLASGASGTRLRHEPSSVLRVPGPRLKPEA